MTEAAAELASRYLTTLQTIASGSPRAHRALPGTEAQALARRVLVEAGMGWPRQERADGKQEGSDT